MLVGRGLSRARLLRVCGELFALRVQHASERRSIPVRERMLAVPVTVPRVAYVARKVGAPCVDCKRSCCAA